MYEQNEPSILRRILWYVLWLIVLAVIVWLVLWAIFFRQHSKPSPTHSTKTSQQPQSSSSTDQSGGSSSSGSKSSSTGSGGNAPAVGTTDTLVDTGPGDILPVAVVVGLAGGAVHYVYQRRRALAQR